MFPVVNSLGDLESSTQYSGPATQMLTGCPETIFCVIQLILLYVCASFFAHGFSVPEAMFQGPATSCIIALIGTGFFPACASLSLPFRSVPFLFVFFLFRLIPRYRVSVSERFKGVLGRVITRVFSRILCCDGLISKLHPTIGQT